jgi:hypothetical protein
MSVQVSVHDSLIERFRSFLKVEGYSPAIQRSYPIHAQHFLKYCDSNALTIAAVSSCHVEKFLRGQHRLFRKRNGQSPPFKKWRSRCVSAVHLILRLVHTWLLAREYQLL